MLAVGNADDMRQLLRDCLLFFATLSGLAASFSMAWANPDPSFKYALPRLAPMQVYRPWMRKWRAASDLVELFPQQRWCCFRSAPLSITFFLSFCFQSVATNT